MKKIISIIMILMVMFSYSLSPTVYADYKATNSYVNLSGTSKPNPLSVYFTLYSGDMLTEHVTSTGTTVRVGFYGCSQGSARISVLNSSLQQITTINIPYRGGTTVYQSFNCSVNEDLTFIVTNRSGNPAIGAFTIYY